MKTRKLKFFGSLSVFMFAIAAAFAFNTPKTENMLAVPGYILKDNVCQQDGHCANTGGPVCTHNGMQLFRKIGSSCNTSVLSGPWQK